MYVLFITNTMYLSISYRLILFILIIHTVLISDFGIVIRNTLNSFFNATNTSDIASMSIEYKIHNCIWVKEIVEKRSKRFAFLIPVFVQPYILCDIIMQIKRINSLTCFYFCYLSQLLFVHVRMQSNMCHYCICDIDDTL